MANGSTRAHEQNDSASREVVNREQLTHSATEAIQDGSSAQRQSMPLITLCREVTACSSRNSPQTASREVPLRSIANFYASVVHWILFFFFWQRIQWTGTEEIKVQYYTSYHPVHT